MADVAITAANVALSGAGQSVDRTRNAGATITAGQLMYVDSSGLWQLAKANGAAALRQVTGIALNNASSGQPMAALLSGVYTVGGTVTVGGVYVLSGANAGGLAPVADLVTGWYTNIVGVGTTATPLQVIFNYPGVAVP